MSAENNSTYLRNAAIVAIENGNTSKIKLIIGKMPLFRLAKYKVMEILIFLLARCQTVTNYEMARTLIYLFDETIEGQSLSDDSYFYKLFLDLRCDEFLLAFVTKAFSKPDRLNNSRSEVVTFSECIVAFMQMDQGPDMYYALSRAIDMYGEQTFSTYKHFQDFADREENVTVKAFMEAQIKKIAPFASAPSYVENFYYEGGSPDETTVYYDIPLSTDADNIDVSQFSARDAADILTAGMAQLGMSSEKIKQNYNRIVKDWKSANYTERQILTLKLQEYIANKQDNPNPNSESNLPESKSDRILKLFRLMGPSNTQSDRYWTGEKDDSEEISLCDEYGCRMLYCVCNDLDDNEDGITYSPDDIDWFLLPYEKVSSCDNPGCLKRIKSREKAFRRPIPLGGWKGRYCSVKCAKKHLSIIENTTQSQGRDIAQRQLIDVYAKQLETWGIQERLI